MPIPTYEEFMLPLLRWLADGEVKSMRDAYKALADEFGLTPEERSELLPSGQREVYKNRIGWTRTYLGKAGLLTYPQKGTVQITDEGRRVLAQNPFRIDRKFLLQYPSFREFLQGWKETQETGSLNPDAQITSQTPRELIEESVRMLNADLQNQVLTQVLDCSPRFFEKLVLELLIRMGYGGSRQEAATILGQPGDGGLDGIIKEDRLGLDVIYVQAKRWENVAVGRPEIQKFVGALEGAGARKGVYLTTSRFSDEARQYANSLRDKKVVLIDGDTLAALMIEHNLGVETEQTYVLKRLDSDFFEEE